MVTRVESAAATRRALLEAAERLLAEGGPDAVTLREVGARAGVTRGAPYGHFEDKQHLLAVVGGDAWDRLTARLVAIRDDGELSARERVLEAVRALVLLGAREPHLYGLMFVLPSSHPEALLEPASRSQDVFLEIVAAVVGVEGARATGALLLAGAHGIAGMESNGHLGSDKWGMTADRLAASLVERVVA